MSQAHRPQSSLPAGVTPGLWEYVQSVEIAEDYDEYFAFNRLFELDEQVLARHFTPPGLVADLGCGTGRALVPLARRGFRGLAVDMSEHMLRIVEDKAQAENLPIDCVHANLVQLDCVPDATADYAICLFSTLGMIHGRENRQRALEHARRILKPGGLFVLHAHNFWFCLFDPDGPWWVLRNLVQSTFTRGLERGDKYLHYRGLSNMFLHAFTHSELIGALRRAGFRVKEMIPLHASRQKPLHYPRFLGRFRANGWIVVSV